MNILIRLCEPNEIQILRDLACKTYDESFRALNTPETMDAYLQEAFDLEKVRAELANPHSWFYFLFTDDMLAGYIKINQTPAQTDINDEQSLELERIYVKRAFKRRGFGKLLIEHAEKIAKSMGKQYVWLGVWEKNSAAIVFYKEMGYEVFDRHTFRMGEELQSDLVMKKILKP
ncbi:MAG: GNAT family N-acetyltransferase [Anaerolineaceae bacterium]|nr:GNAT family N-acetyltransferase [Anaerolineaceae bacterium]